MRPMGGFAEPGAMRRPESGSMRRPESGAKRRPAAAMPPARPAERGRAFAAPTGRPCEDAAVPPRPALVPTGPRPPSTTNRERDDDLPPRAPRARAHPPLRPLRRRDLGRRRALPLVQPGRAQAAGRVAGPRDRLPRHRPGRRGDGRRRLVPRRRRRAVHGGRPRRRPRRWRPGAAASRSRTTARGPATPPVASGIRRTSGTRRSRHSSARRRSPPGQSLAFDQRVTALGTAERPLAVTCSR